MMSLDAYALLALLLAAFIVGMLTGLLLVRPHSSRGKARRYE